MRRFWQFIGFAVAIAICVFFLSGRPASNSPRSVMFTVKKGEGVRDIVTSLSKDGLIASRTYFLYLVWRRSDKNRFQAGKYELSPSMTASDIEKELTGKPISDERTVTILEGWTIDDVAEYLQRKGLATKESFHAQAGESAKKVKDSIPDWSAPFPKLASKPADASLEGYLYPDTYKVYIGSGPDALVRRLLSNFEERYASVEDKDAPEGKRSVHEIMTMASIIEREVLTEQDRAVVSGIFWKRVESGHAIQADSTVNYVTGHSKPSVSYKETQIDNPWNTYKYKGLPPGPIGNPGVSAIRAAIHPKDSPYWFFLTDKDGNVHYARTYDEHVSNIRKYLR
jgi:UPF0755 protein